MGGDPTREPPFFFNKAADALQIVPAGQTVAHPYPPMSSNYHHEIEMVVALKSGGKDIPVEDALSHVFGYAIGLDMTRRDLQDEAKQLRRPWETGKSADLSGPVGPIHPVCGRGPSRQGADPRERQRHAQAERRSLRHDLVGRRADLDPLDASMNSRRAT